MNKVRSNRVARVLWMLVQVACVAFGAWNAWHDPDPGMPRVAAVFVGALVGFFFGLTITVVWTLLYEALRFGLPRLVRRGTEKIHRRQPL